MNPLLLYYNIELAVVPYYLVLFLVLHFGTFCMLSALDNSLAAAYHVWNYPCFFYYVSLVIRQCMYKDNKMNFYAVALQG